PRPFRDFRPLRANGPSLGLPYAHPTWRPELGRVPDPRGGGPVGRPGWIPDRRAGEPPVEPLAIDPRRYRRRADPQPDELQFPRRPRHPSALPPFGRWGA